MGGPGAPNASLRQGTFVLLFLVEVLGTRPVDVLGLGAKSGAEGFFWRQTRPEIGETIRVLLLTSWSRESVHKGRRVGFEVIHHQSPLLIIIKVLIVEHGIYDKSPRQLWRTSSGYSLA